MEQVIEFWSFIALGVILYWALKAFKKAFPGVCKKEWFRRTVAFYAPLAGALVGLVPHFPLPDLLVPEGAGYLERLPTQVIYGFVAGIACSLSYHAFRRLFGLDPEVRGDKE